MAKFVYSFEEGNKNMSSLLGIKGANLAEMFNRKLPVPPGFIISTEACNLYLRSFKQFPSLLWDQVSSAMKQLEKETNRAFIALNDGYPLIVSVRSGAPVSMPGILPTVLNVGFYTETLDRFLQLGWDPKHVYHLYYQLIRSFSRIVHRTELNSRNSEELNHVDVEDLLKEFRTTNNRAFPQDPCIQLKETIAAIFDSWTRSNAQSYRREHEIPTSIGTAIVIQMMVFGNVGGQSGSGVAFSRNPMTGAPSIFGEFLLNSQGEALVTGERTPYKIDFLAERFTNEYRELTKICYELEKVFKSIQDIEFTIENGKLWLLQTRNARLTPMAELKAIVDMVNQNILSKNSAINRLDIPNIRKLLLPNFIDDSTEKALGMGFPSSPGAAVGRIAINISQVRDLISLNEPVLFVRDKLSTDDILVMTQIAGILTQRGGATSHAAVVARGLGVPCVVGCENLEVNYEENEVYLNNKTFQYGDFISIDGGTGEVFEGKRSITAPRLLEFNELRNILIWADEIRNNKPEIYLNADTPSQIRFTRLLGKRTGIGLCRTEWMFFDIPYCDLFHKAVYSAGEDRKKALYELEKLQTDQFWSIFREANHVPITVRLFADTIDNHFSLQKTLVTELSELYQSGTWDEITEKKERVYQAIMKKQQANPRFGMRGVRFLISLPEFMTMQLSSLFNGASKAIKEGNSVSLRILLPNVNAAAEVALVIQNIKVIADSVMKRDMTHIPYEIGVLIETPRSAICISEICDLVQFLCFGTGELTEAVFGYARKDSNRFIPMYLAENIYPDDPFRWFDISGVGALMNSAIQKVKKHHCNITIGAYGPHLNDPKVIHALSDLGLDYISIDLVDAIRLRLELSKQR